MASWQHARHGAHQASSSSGPIEPGPKQPTRVDDEAVHHPDITGRRSRPRRRRWIWFTALVATTVGLTLLFGFGLGRDPSVIDSPLIDRPAPDFRLRTLDGAGVVRSSALRGRVVILNFWASWCAACRDEHPALLASWNRYRDRGVVLVGIDFNDSKGAALAFQRELGGDWPIVEDPGGRTALAYGVYGIPETFFIDRAGIIRAKNVGASSYELLTTTIERLLEEAAS